MTNLYAITMPSITWNKTVWLHVTLNPCPPLLQDPTSVPACCCTYLFVVFTLNLLGAYCWSESSNRWRCRPYSTTQGVVFQSCIANFLIYIQATDKEICVHPGWLVFTCVSLGCRPSQSMENWHKTCSVWAGYQIAPDQLVSTVSGPSRD